MKIRIVSATLAAFLLPQAVSAQQGFIWDYQRYLAEDIFETSLILAYGVPETDARQFWAMCQIGAGRTYIEVTLAAPIGESMQGAPAVVDFQAPSGIGQRHQGEIARHEEFIHGIDFTVETDSIFWQILAGEPNLTYYVEGYSTAQLPLQGSAAPVQQFVEDCVMLGDSGIGEATPDAAGGKG